VTREKLHGYNVVGLFGGQQIPSSAEDPSILLGPAAAGRRLPLHGNVAGLAHASPFQSALLLAVYSFGARTDRSYYVLRLSPATF